MAEEESTSLERVELVEGPEGLELRGESDQPGQGVRATPFLGLERSTGHPLTRILKNLQGPLIDATAGLGTDAGIAAAMGRDVLLIEINPRVHALLNDAIERAEGEEHLRLAQRMHLMHGDASQILRDLPEPYAHPAAVLLDPMFPTRKRQSALPAKPMQHLRRVSGEDDQGAILELLGAAAATRARRVILKRPPESKIAHDALGPVTFSIETKLLRWDVWERG